MNKYRINSIEIINNLIKINQEKTLESQCILDILEKEKFLTEDIFIKILKIFSNDCYILESFLLEIFNDAKNIKIYSDFIFFELKDFKCFISIVNYNGIIIDTSWYKLKKDLSLYNPSDFSNLKGDISKSSYENILKFAIAKKDKKDWRELARLRNNFHEQNNYSQFQLFF